MELGPTRICAGPGGSSCDPSETRRRQLGSDAPSRRFRQCSYL